MHHSALQKMGRFHGVVALLLLGVVAARGQISGNHYPLGAEGIKGSSLPPKGLFFKNYNLFYHATDLKDGTGASVPVNFDVFAYANASRLIYFPDWTFLGGKVGADIVVPVIHTDLTIGAARFSKTGLGDILLEPFDLSWNLPRADLAFAYGVWAPTGDFALAQPASPGKGYWSHMVTVGGTFYLDKERTWAFSSLNRFEVHTRQAQSGITPGMNWDMEWSLSKTVAPGFDLGVSGYLTEQLAYDSAGPRNKDRAYSAGPEMGWFWGKHKLHFSVRYLREFSVKDRPSGGTGTLVVTKIF